MSRDILDLFSLADYEDVFNTSSTSSIPSYNILPDPFQQQLPPTRTTPPQAIQSINVVDNTTTDIPAWRPSRRLQKKLNQLFSDHYNQFPCLPCVYCGKLLYPEKALWITQENLSIYPLFRAYPSILLNDIARTGTVNKLPTCRSCKKPSTRLQFSSLAPIPQEINDVPYSKRKYLSPIFLHSSLGR